MKFKLYTLCVFLTCLLTLNTGFANCSAIDHQATQLMQKNKIKGMAIAIINQGKTEFCNYGYTSSNHQNKINEHTLFEIASISKTFTATLAGIAAAQGLFNLQEPISEYVSELKINPIYHTVNSQELLAHVSGLAFTQETNFKTSNQTDFVNTLLKAKAQYPSQTHYLYGQVGISLVALALEKKYQSSFSDILQKQLLNKLNMQETFVDVPSDYTNRATGYDENNKPVSYFRVGSLTPAAGIKSSTYDLAKYLQLQLDGNHDPDFAKALNIVHQNYYCLYPDGTYQQLAWVYHPKSDLLTEFKPETHNVAHFKPQKLAQHCADDLNGFIEKTGNSYGMSLYAVYSPSINAGVIVLANKARVSDTVNLGRSILKQIDPKKYETN